MKKNLISLALFPVLLFLTPGNVFAVNYTFNDMNYQLIYAEETAFVSAQNAPFDLANNTGVTWGAFEMTLVGFGEFGDYDFMRFADIGSDGIIYAGPGDESFSDVTGNIYDDRLRIDNLSVMHGDMLSFTVDYFGGASPEGLTSYEIYGQPFAAEDQPPITPVPEPGIMFLLGSGLFATVLYSRNKIKV